MSAPVLTTMIQLARRPLTGPADEEPLVGAGERGAGLVEYSMLVALIVLVCVAAVSLLGPTTASEFSSIAVPLR